MKYLYRTKSIFLLSILFFLILLFSFFYANKPEITLILIVLLFFIISVNFYILMIYNKKTVNDDMNPIVAKEMAKKIHDDAKKHRMDKEL